MARGIRRWLNKVQREISRELVVLASGDQYAAALAPEGYIGGYRDALSDVSLALDGVLPARWQERMRNADVRRDALVEKEKS